MPDLKISDFINGGAVEPADAIAAVRAGVDTKVFVGTMAAADSADYSTTDEMEEAINESPAIVTVTGNLTLNDADHNGAEIHLRPNTASPSGYIITVPYSLPAQFRCSFINLAAAGEVQIKLATGSPNDTLNGVASGTATFLLQYAGAYLRKRALGEVVILGGAVSVA